MVSTKSSQLESVSQENVVEYGKLVYVPDSKEGYVLARLSDLASDALTVDLLPPREGTAKVPFAEVLPAEDDPKKDVDDNCALMYLNEATLLQNCRTRYARKQIYTYVANILISINPYEDVPDLYSSSTIQKYQGKSSCLKSS
jgi:myosin-6